MYEVYIKRPADTITVEFDFREFVARVATDGVASGDIRFAVRSAPGITVSSAMSIPGLVVCTVSGGDMGRVYQIGLDATTPDGESQAEVRKVRVRDPSLFGLLPATSEVVLGDASTATYLTMPNGDRLTMPNGDYLTI